MATVRQRGRHVAGDVDAGLGHVDIERPPRPADGAMPSCHRPWPAALKPSVRDEETVTYNSLDNPIVMVLGCLMSG